MKKMQEKSGVDMETLLHKRMEERFQTWLRQNGYQEEVFLQKYRDQELVLQYVIGKDQTRIYLADGLGEEAETLCVFPTRRIEESRDLTGEVTMQASWIAQAVMDKLYGRENNRLRKLSGSADCRLAEHIQQEYEAKVMGF